MRDENKTKEQLINELIELRRRIAELETSETERKRTEERITHLNTVLCAIRNVNQLIVREKDRDRLLQGACDNLVKTPGYHSAWIALIDESGKLVAAVEAGLGQDFWPMVERLKRCETTYCIRMALAQVGVLIIEDPASTCTDCPLSGGYGGRGRMAVRLERGGKVYGLLTASISAELVANEEERALFEEVAEDIAFALYSLELEEERKRAEKALRESEERYRSLFEGAEDHIFVVDQDFRYVTVSPSALKAGGFTLEDVVGKGPRELFPEDAEFYLSQYRHAFETGEPVRFEREMRLPTGLHWFSVTLSPIKDGRGRVIALTGVSRDITERKRADGERERRSQELVMLNEIGRAVTSSLDLKEVLAFLLDRAHQGLDAEACSVALLDDNGDLIFYHAEGEAAEAVIGLRLKPGQGIAGYVAQSGRSALVPDVHADPHFYGEVAPDFTTRDMVCVPLVVRDEIIGVIELLNKRQGTFAEEDVRMLESVATQATTAIENARLFELTQRQSERLAQTLTLSEMLHRGLELEQVLEQIAQGAAGLGFRQAVINVYQPEEDVVRVRAMAALRGPGDEKLMTATYRWSDFQILMQERFRVSRSYLIRQGEIDWEKDLQGVTVTPNIEDRGPGYWRPDDALMVPLRGSHGELVALLSMDEPVGGLVPDLNTIQTLEAFANQAAIAIENARLYQAVQRELAERKRAEEAMELRAEQLAALSQASQAVTASLELDQVLAEIVSLASEVSASDYTSVVLVDEAGNIGQSAENVPGVPAIEHRIRGKGLTSWIVRSGRAVVIDEIGEDGVINPDLGEGAPRFANPLIVEAGVKSFAGLPLMVKDHLLGVLYLYSLHLGAFHGQLPLLTAFANQAAIAIENARLYQAVQRELAERKRAEEALRRSEEAHRLLFEQSVDGIIIIAKGRIVRANHAFCAFHGLPVERIVGMNPLDSVHPDDRDIGAQRIQALQAEEPVSESYVYRTLREDGSVFWGEARSKRIEWEGEPALQTIVRDVTERKWAEEEIRRLNQFLDSVIDNANVWLNVLDEKANVVLWNKAAEEISSYSREEVVGHGKIWEWLYPDEKYRNQIIGEAIAIIERGGKEEEGETIIRRKDGQTRVISWNSRSLMDEKGTPTGSIAIGHDVTERKQLEAQLRQAQKMTAIGQLAGGIAHDFNNLLTPIGGFAELLLQKASEDSQQQAYLRQIKTAAERAAALTRQLRLFTRQARGEHRPVQLNRVVEETRDLLERSIPKEITIELRLASELWVVEADPSQIDQVLMNLCLNARDAMPDGGTLTLETRNVTLDEEQAQVILDARPGRYVRLSVSDTGCGMSPEVQARLFEPFFTTKEAGRGTGLGLAVVYGIVKGHGGFINVYSQEGQGSTFHVYLPAIELAVEERKVEGLELPTGTETILVVDDEEMVLALGQRVLELCGYTVLMAENGLRALEVYQAHRGEIGLVVLDVIMPQMGGLECLQRLRELDRRVKVLISTGYTVKSLAQELVAEGALGVVDKPFLLQDFATAVRTALDKP